MQSLHNIKADTELKLDYAVAKKTWEIPVEAVSTFVLEDVTTNLNFDFLHQENDYVDYNRDGLLKQMYSTQGPALAVGDVNGDGLDDAYIGGGAGKLRVLFVQQSNGKFIQSSQTAFTVPNPADETAATFFDADGDKDLDLYVVTGGNEFLKGDPKLTDQLYLNDGKGNFGLSTGLPALLENGSCVAAADFDRDGDQDLFVGTRMISSQYGLTPRSYLLQNDGKGHFKDVTAQQMPNNSLGMVTDARFEDLNKDGYPELIAVGDWMPITILQNQKGTFPTALNQAIPQSNGWWNRLETTDIDKDGDIDFIVGNLGRNTKLQCSEKQPVTLYINDFDKSGTVEQIIVCHNPDGKPYPMVLKSDLQKVLPVIKKRFVKHADYAGQPFEEIFTSEQMQGAQTKSVNQPNSSLLLNDGKGNFELIPLPLEAQLSPIFGIVATDFDHDGKLDILLTGNFFDVLPEIGRYDGNTGLILKGLGKDTNGKPQFVALKPSQTGFSVKGQVRNMKKAKSINGKTLLLLAKNKDRVQVFDLLKSN